MVYRLFTNGLFSVGRVSIKTNTNKVLPLIVERPQQKQIVTRVVLMLGQLASDATVKTRP